MKSRDSIRFFYICTMKHKLTLIFAIAASMFTGCNGKEDPDIPVQPTKEEAERTAVNIFAYNTMNIYYLWNEEIAGSFEEWSTDDDPVEKVYNIRYKDAEGKDIDRWTMVTDSYTEMVSDTDHISKTYGMDFKLYYADSSKEAVYMVITLVYPSSPASEAGISRGCCFTMVNGKKITEDNYYDLITDEVLSSSTVRLTELNGSEVSMTAVEMYEDPVLVHKVFDVDGRKIGYLFYNSFTLDSIKDLVSAASEFKSAGVTELILDLRYNPGGYVYAETALASLLAPESEVRAESVFETNIYNKTISFIMGDSNSYFAPSLSDEVNGKKIEADLISSNLNLSKIYVIMTGSTASASESLITGLKPYMDISIFGSRSYGKFCMGIMRSAKDWYRDIDAEDNPELAAYGKYAGDWGIYVMIGRFADKYGNTPCMPDGFEPDFLVDDDPTSTAQLGDGNEAMLNAVLDYIRTGSVPATRAPEAMPEALPSRYDASYGKSILLYGKDGLLH